MTNKIDIKEMTLPELKEEMKKLGEPAFRAGQIYDWLHVRCVRSFDEMTNLSKVLRSKLSEEYDAVVLKQEALQVSAIDGTRKYLFELPDGNFVESVWMDYKFGASVCISSQVGCRMGCKFCASTLDGLERGLKASEMLDQIYAITADTGKRVSHVVIMGTGEPLDNYDNVVRFLRMLTDENGLNISQRDVTLSTCGIVPNIKRLAEEDLSINLAISLHAPTDEKRKKLMPIANQYSIAELMDACRYYFEKTGRRITFEYSLVAGQNDNKEEAEELASLVSSLNCHVNLIPVNPVKECGLPGSSRERAGEFAKWLERKRIQVTVRREMGRDIDGACGQLRRRHADKT